MRKGCRHLIFLAGLFFQLAVFGQGDEVKIRRSCVPAYVPLQFAGNIGLVSSGVGWIPKNGIYRVAMMYGYVPESVAKYSAIHIATLKNSFDFHRFRGRNEDAWVAYLGLGITLETGGISFLMLPSNYPPGSYFPKAVHLVPFAGVRYDRPLKNSARWLKGISPYIEAGTVDAFIWYKARSESVAVTQVFSAALGINFMLE
jgi:hypothetical protein